MDLDIKVSADYTEVNKVINGLMAAMMPKPIHSLAAKTALKQVKSKYADRFLLQVSLNQSTRHARSGSIWQDTKEQVGDQLPLGPAPGFLTGTTFKSLVAEASHMRGFVYPKGPWPQGSGSAQTISISSTDQDAWAGFEWDASGLYARLAGGEPLMFASSPSMMNRSYGGYSSKAGIEWLFLDAQDIDIVMANLRAYFTYVVEQNYSGLKAVFNSTKYTGIGSEDVQEELEADVAGIESASINPRTQNIEKRTGSTLDEIIEVLTTDWWEKEK